LKILASFIKVNLILLIFLAGLGLCQEAIVAEGQAPIIMGHVRDAYCQALNKAMEDAVNQALLLVLPKPNKSIIENAKDFIKSYNILQQNCTNFYKVQIEARIDWEKLAKDLSKRDILFTGDGEGIILLFKAPSSDIDIKPQIFPILERFFLIFGLRPVTSKVEEEKILDYAYNSGIPLVFVFSLKIASVMGGWRITGKGKLMETLHKRVIAEIIEKRSVINHERGGIDALTISAQELTHHLVMRLSSHLQSWLKKQKKKIHKVILRVLDVHTYSDVFSLLKEFSEIAGMRHICLCEVSPGEVAYEGYYSNPISYLLNELATHGFLIDGIKRKQIFIHR